MVTMTKDNKKILKKTVSDKIQFRVTGDLKNTV